MLSHERAPLLYAGGVVLAAALLTLAPLVGSIPVAAGAGVAAGGALATVICGLAWSDGVPNPLLRGGVVFNVADLAIGGGVALLVGGALAHAWRNRARLHQPI